MSWRPLLEGDDGTIVQQVQIDEFSGFQLGAYGGAVDAEGNLYFTPMGAVSFGGQLARVDIDDYTVQVWPIPQGVSTYGITVDHDGNPWMSSTLGATAARFNIADETWDTVSLHAVKDVSSPFGKDAGRIEVPVVADRAKNRALTPHRFIDAHPVEHVALDDRQLRMVDLKP